MPPRSIVALAALAICLAGPAHAQTAVVDQANDDTSTCNLGAALNDCCAQTFQTFVVGKTGTLVGVNAFIGGSSTATSQLRLSIQGTLSGLPDGITLASTTLPTASTGMNDFVAFDPGLPVVAGTQYALVADFVNAPPPSPSGCQGNWAGTTGDRYAAGQYVISYYGWQYVGLGYDLFFRTWVVPDDGDDDGFAFASDCNDADASVHAGATEVAHDGVDQDCNGYDLTVDVLKAHYSTLTDELRVEASSDLAGAANLTVDGRGAMSWKANQLRWTLNAIPAGGNPGAVTVCGVEGCTSAPVTVVE